MKRTLIKILLSISVILASIMSFNLTNQALAAEPDDTEKVDVLISFTEQPGDTEQALIENEGGKVKRNYHVVPAIAASIPKSKLEALRRNPKVAAVEEDITVQSLEDEITWGIDRIDAELVHSQYKGQGVKVAILDSGIDLDHPDLRVAGNVTFVPGTTSGDDDFGHGTMVAGIVAALDNGIGIVGVAPEAELYSVKVLDQNGLGVSSSILSGIEWAIDNGMQVINMGFGSYLEMPLAVRTALDRAYQAGIVLVAGAGNGGDTGVIYAPARYESVIAVGATDQQDARASFSSTGITLEFMAPGVDVISTSRDGGYSNGSGTSFSTPHVTGIAALLLSSGVTNNVEVRQILRGTAQDLGQEGFDNYYGMGLVNAAKAIGVTSNNESSDSIPPLTKIVLNGLKGNKIWYHSDVMVELTAADNLGGSGVAKTEYSLDGGITWNIYTSPLTFTTENTKYTVLARSWDNAGNCEGPPALVEFKIDKTPPTVTESVTPTEIKAVRPNEVVWVNYKGTAEDWGSRLYGPFNTVLLDEYGELNQDLGSPLWGSVALKAWCNGNDKDGRTYIIRLTAHDYAGNEATAEAVVTILHKGKAETTEDTKGKLKKTEVSVRELKRLKNQKSEGVTNGTKQE